MEQLFKWIKLNKAFQMLLWYQKKYGLRFLIHHNRLHQKLML